jgi:7-cyano-7-deazaguanine synthase
MKKAVILLSGGLDSSTCLTYAAAKGYECYALSLNYGQKQLSELSAAKKLAKKLSIKDHKIINLDLQQFGGSALTDSKISVPAHQDTTSIPITYVPARNTIMLSIAAGFAETVNANNIFIGVSAVDYANYPDCRLDYIAAFTTMINLATKKGRENHDYFKIHTPIINLSKAETIKLGISLGLDYADTVSCYAATEDGLACGKCSSCHFRKKGFIEANIKDPTRYV